MDSKGTTVVSHFIYGVLIDSYSYTTLRDTAVRQFHTGVYKLERTLYSSLLLSPIRKNYGKAKSIDRLRHTAGSH